jgi:hypothetical protein
MHLSRRDWLSAAAGLTAAASPLMAFAPDPTGTPADRERRMAWWHEARFGMFIHWGLYSVLGRHEWAMEEEGIPVAEYELLAKRFNPKPHAARAWAKLAKRAGMRYMVMTTKHHEGFCQFRTETTNYCAPRQAAGRDLVAEYVEAARAEGLRFGFYFSLMDWHHPDGARCATDPEARHRFVDYAHAQIHELTTNYGKVDVLWYDVAWPLDAAGWESEKMNQMVFQLQPDIIVNNRNKLEGDFQTPEQRIAASDKAWEACMTMNDSWGYQRADDDWKSPKTVVRNLITCARRRQLPAEYRTGSRRVDPRRIRAHSERGGRLDAGQRQDHLRRRALQGEELRIFELHAQGEHAVRSCVFLAGREPLDRRAEKQSAGCDFTEDRRESGLRAGRFPCAVQWIACDRARYAGDRSRGGMRWGAGSG